MSKGGDNDWAHMDPDQVFRRLNVKEIKKVEQMLRAQAQSKQEELRSMVRWVDPTSRVAAPLLIHIAIISANDIGIFSCPQLRFLKFVNLH